MIVSHILTSALVQSEKFSLLCGAANTVISPTFKLTTGELTSGPNGFSIKTSDIEELITMLRAAKEAVELAGKIERENKKVG